MENKQLIAAILGLLAALSALGYHVSDLSNPSNLGTVVSKY